MYPKLYPHRSGSTLSQPSGGGPHDFWIPQRVICAQSPQLCRLDYSLSSDAHLPSSTPADGQHSTLKDHPLPLYAPKFLQPHHPMSSSLTHRGILRHFCIRGSPCALAWPMLTEIPKVCIGGSHSAWLSEYIGPICASRFGYSLIDTSPKKSSPPGSAVSSKHVSTIQDQLLRDIY